MRNKLIKTLIICFTPLISATTLVSCSNKQEIEVATYEEAIEALKVIDFKIDVYNEGIDLNFSYIDTIDENGNEIFVKEWIAYGNFIKKQNFLNDFNSNYIIKTNFVPPINIPLFAVDARGYLSTKDGGKYKYYTIFDLDGIDLISSPNRKKYWWRKFDIGNKKNYSFLYSEMEKNNKYNTTMSIPKWYLRLIAEDERYIVQLSDGSKTEISEFWLQIKPINPYDSDQQKNSTNWISKKRLNPDRIPFWLAKVVYNTKEDTFTAEIKDPDEQFDPVIKN